MAITFGLFHPANRTRGVIQVHLSSGDKRPWQERQHRIGCLAARSKNALKIAHLLCAVAAGPHTYTVCPVEALNGNEPGGESMNAAEPDEIKTDCADALS